MAGDTNFFDLIERRIKLSLHTFAPARVIKFNEGKRTVDVELLFLSVDKNGDTDRYPLIEDAPVLGHRYKVDGIIKTYSPVLQTGDVVFVAFAERALDNLNGGKPFDPEYRRTHDIRDAVVLGVLF
ncbi:Gp138 family membrane-puncturing spike protein [Fictibacillus gelatini]|uniref:Gp138 family membrane-puncturing spike protein n=1 Tax=Fictibacillus gelatini TaxID=225985 RepID=UPI00047C5AB2|nr:Gp138 family membrane-puncturing spike protein [Fictibacillus gelatini]